MAEPGFFKCLLCDVNTTSKYHLTQHIYHHLSYRKYQCSSCTELFYTEEEREIHCRRRGHIHIFEIKVSPYSELYVNLLLKDAEYVAVHGLDAVIMQRSKANLACDVAMNKLPRTVYATKTNIEAPIVQDQPSLSATALRKSSKTTSASRFGVDVSPLSDRPSSSTSKPKISPKATLSNSTQENSEQSFAKPTKRFSQGNINVKDQRPADDWTRVELDNCANISSATQMLGEALRTTPAELRCMLCKTITSSEYVVRKHHVSSNHMPKDHTKSDYVEILSDTMKKAYPTLPFNDLQCQLGGCRKEYKCQSSRRSHVLRTHFQNELDCPLKCSYRSNDFSLLNSHLKEDHGLRNGHMSIDSQHVREQFNAERAKHNFLLNSLVLQAFPCPIPDCYNPNFKGVEASPGDTVHNIISRIREKSRHFQGAPPNPLRLRSPSSDSDSGSSEKNKVSEGLPGNTVTNSKTSNVPSPQSTTGNQVMSAPVSASTTSSSTSSSSSDETSLGNNKAKSIKKHSVTAKDSTTPRKSQRSEGVSVAKRKRAASTSSSSLSSSSSSNCTNVHKTIDNQKSSSSNTALTNNDVQLNGTEKEISRSGRNPDTSSSSSSSSSSEDEGDVQVVKEVKSTTKPSPRVTSKPMLHRVILDDDDDDDEEQDVTFVKFKPGKTPEKKTEVRTLAISGVSIRGAGIRASPSEMLTQSAPSAGRMSRRLPISAVSVPIDKTPVSSFKRRSYYSDGGSASWATAPGSFGQSKRKRESVRRKNDLNERLHTLRPSFKKKRSSSVKGKGSGTTHRQNGLKMREKAHEQVKLQKGSSNDFASGNGTPRKPSYIVKKVKREVSTPKRSSYPQSSWKGTLRRFD